MILVTMISLFLHGVEAWSPSLVDERLGGLDKQCCWVATSTIGAPSPRFRHTSVWTGSEMIVWGGTAPDATDGLSDGARYNTVTDHWTQMARPEGLTQRLGHSAVWTGTEMIVWGGTGVDLRTGRVGPLVDGARYNPATDSWTMLPPSPLRPRTDFSVVWTGSTMIVWGGFAAEGGEGMYFDDGASYVPALNDWIPIAPSGSARSRHTAVWSGGEMLVWGGTSDRGLAVEGGARYRPASDTWAPISVDAAPTVSSGHISIWTGSEMIVWGGPAGLNDVGIGGRYDPVSDSWKPISMDQAPSGRYRHTGVWTDRELIIWGGMPFARLGSNIAGRGTPFRTDAASYEPAGDTWLPLPEQNSPESRVYHTAVWTGSEMIVWGGVADGTLDSGGRYRPPALNESGQVRAKPCPTPNVLSTASGPLRF